MQHYSTWFVVDYQGESEETLRSITYQVPKTPAKSGRFPELPEHPVRRKGGRGSSDLPWGHQKAEHHRDSHWRSISGDLRAPMKGRVQPQLHSVVQSLSTSTYTTLINYQGTFPFGSCFPPRSRLAPGRRSRPTYETARGLADPGIGTGGQFRDTLNGTWTNASTYDDSILS